jgi:hypothetical protein
MTFAAIFLAVVAVAYGGSIVQSFASPPASTVKLANVAPVVTYSAGPVAYASGPVVHAAPVAYASGPVVHSAPVAYASGPVIHSAPIAYSTGAKIVHTVEPIEAHGYQIAY